MTLLSTRKPVVPKVEPFSERDLTSIRNMFKLMYLLLEQQLYRVRVNRFTAISGATPNSSLRVNVEACVFTGKVFSYRVYPWESCLRSGVLYYSSLQFVQNFINIQSQMSKSILLERLDKALGNLLTKSLELKEIYPTLEKYGLDRREPFLVTEFFPSYRGLK